VTALLSVASIQCAGVDARLVEGRRLFAARAWQASIEEFEHVRRKTCHGERKDPRCKEAMLRQAEAHLELGDPRKSYWMLERAQSLFPSATADVDMQAAQKRAQLAFASRLARQSGLATIRTRFDSQTTPSIRLHLVGVTIDLMPIRLEGLGGTDGTRVRGSSETTIVAGEHEVDVLGIFDLGGRYPPGYRLLADSHQKFVVANGEVVEADLRFVEAPLGTRTEDVIKGTIEIRLATK